jgi:uncharacterized membrane protein
MNQDKEAMLVLVLGILFCLIIIITSYSTDNSTSQIVDKWNGERASNQYSLFLIDLKAENKDN